MLIITERNHTISPVRQLSRISVDHEVIFFFPSWDKPRGDTISMSGSLKAVINFVMYVFFSRTLLLITLRNCVVCTSLKRIRTTLYKMRRQSIERSAS